MSEQRVVGHSVLMDVDEASVGPLRPRRPVDKTFRTYDQDQPMLLAPDLRDWLAAEHPARWVDALVEDGLDLSPIYDDYTDVRGGPPYDPRLMVKILIYGYSHGITSSRALERRCHDDIAYGFLTAQQAPDFVAISRFSDPARRGIQGAVHAVAGVVRQGWPGLVGAGRFGRLEDPGLSKSAPGDE